MTNIKAGNILLHCKVDGEGKACCFLHGSYLDGMFWQEQTPAFSKRFITIVPDLCGHGQSDKPKEEYTPELMAKDVHNLLKALGIKQTILIGHSLGCRIALQTVLDYPEIVEKLVLSNGNAGPVQGRADIFPENVKREIGFGLPSFDLEKYIYYEVWFSFANPDHDKVQLIHEKILGTPDYVKASIGRHFSKLDLRSRLSEIRVPSLVITGEKDVICPMESSEYMAEHIPDARFVVISDVGHCLPVEKPNEFNSKVLSFLEN
ncbi:alpha/beta fold hydrolase [Thermoproteota archaeon]